MNKIKSYFSLIKFSHTIFAMPFAVIGFSIGWESPYNLIRNADGTWSSDSLRVMLSVIACMIFARSAAMAFNRYLDRDVDAKNPRTANREIPAGIIQPNQALIFTIICSILFVCSAALINAICFYLSFVALFVVLVYSYTKRFTAWCHLVLGLGLSLAPIGAYLAVTGRFDWIPLLFSGVVITWVSGFDVMYAMQDEGFDQHMGLHSIPAHWGGVRALRISEGLHILTTLCLIAIGIFGHWGWLYWVGSIGFIAMLIYQHRLVKPNDLSKINLAFMTANGIASVVFSVAVLIDLFILKTGN
jgi:4-hydroxybenzoate polyprenyltransferase